MSVAETSHYIYTVDIPYTVMSCIDIDEGDRRVLLYRKWKEVDVLCVCAGNLWKKSKNESSSSEFINSIEKRGKIRCGSKGMSSFAQLLVMAAAVMRQPPYGAQLGSSSIPHQARPSSKKAEAKGCLLYSFSLGFEGEHDWPSPVSLDMYTEKKKKKIVKHQ